MPTVTQVFNFGADFAGQAAWAQAVDTLGVPLAPYSAAGLVEMGAGQYLGTFALPDGFTGALRARLVTNPAVIDSYAVSTPPASVGAGGSVLGPPAPGQASHDMDAVRALAGVSADEWPDSLVASAPYLGAAQVEAARRIPCDWARLDPASTQNLRLALIYQAASLVVPAANPAKAEDFKVGSFNFKTNDAMLLGDVGTLMSWANQYYSQVILPPGVVPLAIVDAYARPVIRKANTARRRPFGGGCY